MPKPGYTKRHFTEDFKMRTVYEIKNGIKTQKDIVHEATGLPVSKTLSDRWIKKLGDKVQIGTPATSFQHIPASYVPPNPTENELLLEIGRLHLRLARYEDPKFGGRRRSDMPLLNRA